MPARQKPSKTAELVATIRMIYTIRHKPPIFADDLAEHFCSVLWRAYSRSRILTWLVFDVIAGLGPISLNTPVRAAYCEEQVVKAIQAGIGQYVILGAGYDCFGLRRTDLKDQVIDFELDQPATQQLKLNKLRQKKLAVADNIRFVAGDLS